MTGHLIVAEALARLAIARGTLLDDTASEVYLDGVKDLAPPLVQRACAALSKIARADYEPAMPSVGVIREHCRKLAATDAAETAARKLLPLPKSDEDGPRYFCLDCKDESSGWRSCWCAGLGPTHTQTPPTHATGVEHTHCGRPADHDPHYFAVRCHCTQINPVVARRRTHQRVRPQRPA